MSELPPTPADGDPPGPERPFAIVEDPPPGPWQRALAGWRVYLVTALMLPLSAWLSAMIVAVVVAAMVGWRIARGELAGGDFSLQAQLLLNQLLQGGVTGMVVGVLANSATFGFVAVILASRVPRLHDVSPEVEREASLLRLRERLRLGPARPADFALAMIGLIGLTVTLDSLIVLAGLADTGSLAEMRHVVAALSISERLLLAIVVALGAGLAEELFFRGYMMSALGRIHGAPLALVLSSIAFGIFHLDAIHSPVAGLMGAFLGMVVLTTGSLWPAVFAHVMNNLSALVFAEAEATPYAWALGLAPAGVCVSALALWALRRAHRGERHPTVW